MADDPALSDKEEIDKLKGEVAKWTAERESLSVQITKIAEAVEGKAHLTAEEKATLLTRLDGLETKLREAEARETEAKETATRLQAELMELKSSQQPTNPEPNNRSKRNAAGRRDRSKDVWL